MPIKPEIPRTPASPPPDGWEQDRRDKVTLWLSATPTQRLRWLEEMIRFAWQCGALPRPEETARRPPEPTDRTAPPR